MIYHTELIKVALNSGAEKAIVILGKDIVLSSSFRAICATNACGLYGKCWTCPPYIGDIEKLIKTVKTFEYGLLYQTINTIEDSFDIEGMNKGCLKHIKVGQQINNVIKSLLKTYLHLSCGGCHLCERCACLDKQPCRMPEKALLPMEGYGIDVYQTTKSTPLKYINGQNTVTFFGIILF